MALSRKGRAVRADSQGEQSFEADEAAGTRCPVREVQGAGKAAAGLHARAWGAARWKRCPSSGGDPGHHVTSVGVGETRGTRPRALASGTTV
jgi:hypothetical protein